MASSGYSLVLCSWPGAAEEIRALRQQVLVSEMGLPGNVLNVPADTGAYHVLVHDSGGRAVGAACMQPDGQIDYVLVLRPWRCKTVGGALLAYLHHIAQARNLAHIWTVVPTVARRFFEKNRFTPCEDNVLTAFMSGLKYVRPVRKPGSNTSVTH